MSVSRRSLGSVQLNPEPACSVGSDLFSQFFGVPPAFRNSSLAVLQCATLPHHRILVPKNESDPLLKLSDWERDLAKVSLSRLCEIPNSNTAHLDSGNIVIQRTLRNAKGMRSSSDVFLFGRRGRLDCLLPAVNKRLQDLCRWRRNSHGNAVWD